MGAGPLLQEGGQGLLGPQAVVPLEGEADVAAGGACTAMEALRLHDGIEADRRIGQGTADGGGGAGTIGHPPHGDLGLVAVEGHAAHRRCIQAAELGVEPQLALLQLEGFGGGPQGPLPLVAGHQAAHLHLAGGDQAQVDAGAGQGVEQTGRHPRPAHDAGTGDAQLGQAGLGAQLGAADAQRRAHRRQHFTAHQLGPVEIGSGQGEGDVVGGALVGGLHDQVHIEASGAQGFKQLGGHAGAIGHVGQGDHRLLLIQLGAIHRLAQLQAAVADRPG